MAGPVVVAAVLVPRSFYPRPSSLPRLRDSKKLNPGQREAWFKYIKGHPAISYTTARIYPRRIEKFNIARCANLAAARAFQRLNLTPKNISIFLDGSLYLGSRPNQPSFARTITKGDEKFVVIKLASIIAKVTRDRYMIKLHQKEPLYRFNLHKGYGTRLHRSLIRRHGPAEVHRLTYLKKYRRLALIQ